MNPPAHRLTAALAKARQHLLAARHPAGHWEGELSSSALSTATAVCALSLWRQHANPRPPGAPLPEHLDHAITHGLRWLAQHANPDGGWGDTVLSVSNISTTALCWAAFGAVHGADTQHAATVHNAEAWLAAKCSENKPQPTAPRPPSPAPATAVLDRPALIRAIIARYGKDRTFSVPILTMCALAGRLGTGSDAWRGVIPLPFELAALPQNLFAALRLPVVSYALPALIAIGQARHHHAPSRNPVARLLRHLIRDKTLRVLTKIQPPGGGFLEATPLTSFVTMSLAGSGHTAHPVTLAGLNFLLASLRPDGSWPIDTNLATWVTTLAINALDHDAPKHLPASALTYLRDWLLHQQYRSVHPYTNAPPGGWAWTNLAGGVPDADDTPGALLALRHLTSPPSADTDPRVRDAVIAGVTWLLNLQNRDGGIPTFCRGWTNLPFDRSSPDLTAHTLRAWIAWRAQLPAPLAERLRPAITRALHYLARTQRPDGSWLPLWFGNQRAPDDENPTYGTARVLLALAHATAASDTGFPSASLHELLRRGATFLAGLQHPDGGWSAASHTPPSVEETALAVEALAHPATIALTPATGAAAHKGAEWLLRKIEDDTWTRPSPIGFYFAKLWYFEHLYPVIFTVAALEQLHRSATAPSPPAPPPE